VHSIAWQKIHVSYKIENNRVFNIKSSRFFATTLTGTQWLMRMYDISAPSF